MIKKLRWRVVTLTMIAVFIVLLVLMGIVNAANYISTNRSVDEKLELLVENGGSFPMFGKKHDHGPMGAEGGAADGTAEGNMAGGNAAEEGNMVGGKPFDDGLRPGMSKETPYETRYFSVALDSEGESVRIDTTRIAVVDDSAASELVDKVSKTSKDSAYINYEDAIYKYKVATVSADALSGATAGAAGNTSGATAGAGENASGATTVTSTSSDGDEYTMYVFVDATRDMDSVKQFLIISLLVSLGGLVAIGALVIALAPAMIRPIAESYEKQKKFITNASHELKTPMAVIKSCNEVVELENGSSKWTAAISEQVDRLSDLTGKLVALSRMDEAADLAGKNSAEMEFTEVDFAEVLTETLSPFSLMAEQKGQRFSCSVNGASIDLADAMNSENLSEAEASDKIQNTKVPSIIMRGNRAALIELVNILADNAIKYCAPDGEIKFSLNKSGNKITLTEENPAEGLTRGNMNILFDRFYRGDQAHSNSVGGYGIGLSMAQSIVNAHGGSISASSPDGECLTIKATF